MGLPVDLGPFYTGLLIARRVWERKGPLDWNRKNKQTKEDNRFLYITGKLYVPTLLKTTSLESQKSLHQPRLLVRRRLGGYDEMTVQLIK